MSEHREKSPVRIGIADETITPIGSLHSYVERLDEAMRLCACSHQHIVTPIIGPGIQQAEVQASPPVKKSLLRRVLRKVLPLRWLYRRVRRFRHPRWPEAKNWARKWRNMPGDVVCLIPHAVIVDGGELDVYYDAIADRRFIWVIHDLHGYYFPDQWDEDQLIRMRRRFRFLSERASGIIVHNEFTALDVSQKLGIPRERVSVIRLAPLLPINSQWASVETEEEVLAKLGITRPYALWASSSTYSHKNHERMLYAWRTVLDHGHHLHLVCTGHKGPRWEKVNACIHHLGLEHSVRFTGVISESELAIVLHNAHIAVCPTLYEGGGCGPANEALMASIPLAASDIPQIRQYFNGREDMFLFFDPTSPNAIAQAVEAILLRDYDTAKRHAEWARTEYLAMQSWEMTASEYWRAIEQAVMTHE
ncbi:MAG: glycosyltransferase [Terracidiphilus sp.]